ncbi:MAG: Asp-tRNA(Asn)/Glu-tRNA(Gln) amidotransferase subunit GatB [Clostridiales bacterium]|jgi:aspartyl-tRNA(Asn)/glutamyl-tRNA(Gln) amidotransferase subunit B|nr:Asp-tRNA(Asn)/Glu-tRNA(Gln) amidotransferase subunit GatB [Clostridiales bacterium]
MNGAYIPTIGLEIHCELKTASKIFCGCPNVFGAPPNTQCCPVCLGFPGTLPVLNRRAVEYTVRMGLAIGAEIPAFSKWDRKNYFYPDLPKAWQTSQYDLPLVKGGRVAFMTPDGEKTVRIERIHLEEDAGKLIHENGFTRVDYNRGGVPLMEIVTLPDLHGAAEAVAFLTELKSIIKYIGVSDVKMQEGSLRCDVNLSLSRPGEPLGTRTETKNLNSFSAAARAIEFEIGRQTEILAGGGSVLQETRRWDDAKGRGYALRSKEDAQDYRYFPEPDLPPVVLDRAEVEAWRRALPVLRYERAGRYTREFGLSGYDAGLLTGDRAVSDLFDGTVALGANPKKTANLIMGDVLRLGREEGGEDVAVGLSPAQLYGLLSLIEGGVIGLAAVQKDVLPRIWNTDIDPETFVKEAGLAQSGDADEIAAAVREIIAQNPRQADDYRAGNEKLLAFFVGRVMKATKGKCNPKTVNEVLTTELKKR